MKTGNHVTWTSPSKALRQWKSSALFSATVLCWLTLTGCPALLSQYDLLNYLPLHQGNVWTFGCAGVGPDDPTAGILQDFSIERTLSVNGHWVWVVSQQEYSATSTTPLYGPDTYYVFEGNVLYTATSLEAIDDLPGSLNGGAFKAFVHGDLTPRTIDDPNDPVQVRYGGPIRYTAGALSRFLPIAFERQASNGGDPVSGTVGAGDFGDSIRDLTDCIVLEVNVAESAAEPEWVPALILGRSVGPLLAQDGNGGYIALRSASTLP